MKIASALLLALSTGFLHAHAQQSLPDPGYKLAWSDDFDGNALDESRWQYRTDSKMLSTQMPGNVTVGNGFLTIHLRKEHAGEKAYTGGGIISRQPFGYGYYEARLKIIAGSGWHSSFWLMAYNGKDTTGSGSEFDIIENQSKDLHYYEINTHRWTPTHMSTGTKGVYPSDLSHSFHIFGCEYMPNLIRYYLDGKLVATVDWTGQPQGKVNIWITAIAEAMGPNHGVDESALPGEMIVDWMRYYKK